MDLGAADGCGDQVVGRLSVRYQKVLLLNPPYSGSRVNVVFSAGLGYVAEYLLQQGIAYEVLDMSLGYAYPALKKKIRDWAPDLIGISMMSYRYKDTYRLLERVKRDFPSLAIMAGGPHLSLFRKEVMQNCLAIDYGAVLEGEETIKELCQGSPLEMIKGLLWRQGEQVLYNGDRPFINDLDKLPFPTYTNFELDRSINKNFNALPIISSRGCPYHCIYCPVKCSIGEIFRARTPENILKELTYWYERGYRRFSFGDDNFTLQRERVYRLCELVRENHLTGLKLSCDNGVRADKVDLELLQMMKETGFYRIAFGVEAGNNKILANLKKKEDIEVIKQRIRESCGLGYEVDLFFLVGSPGETSSDLEDSFALALNFPINTAFFYNIIPFPGTELFTWIEQHGKFLSNYYDYLQEYPIFTPLPLFETKEMDKTARTKALRKAFQIMRQTMRRSWSRKLKQYGLLGKILAYLYTSKFAQDFLLRRKMFNTIIIKIAKRMGPSL